MTEEYKQIYNQQDELIKESFRLLNIYVNGYKMLQDSGLATEQNKNLFRLAYCCLFNLLENAVIRREIIRATDNTYNIEGQYSNRRMLVSIYEMNKHLFGVNEKTRLASSRLKGYMKHRPLYVSRKCNHNINGKRCRFCMVSERQSAITHQ